MTTKRVRTSRMLHWIGGNAKFLAFVLLFGVFRTAIADWNPIPSASMHPNLLEGDVVFVNRLAFNIKLPLTDVVVAHTGDPKRGAIVTFSSPENGTRVRSAPFLPGASPTNITRASGEPLSSLNTAVRPHIAGQRVQLAASLASFLNNFALFTL